jgi:excisionase family DNA binding protein
LIPNNGSKMGKSDRENEIVDELCVRRETIIKLFDPPPDECTFHDWVNKGAIDVAGGLNGYYLLNATRVRLGMNPVDTKLAREEWIKPNNEVPEEEREAPVIEVESPVPGIRANPPCFMKVDEAATYLTVSPATIRREIKAGRLKSVRLGRRVLLRREDVDQSISSNADWLD